MKKRLFSLLTSLLMVISMVGILPVMTASAENDSIANAENYSLGTTKSSSITSNVNARVYKFTLASSGRLNISYTGYLENSSLYIYDSNGDECHRNYWIYWNDNTKKSNVNDYVDLTKGTYYF